MKITTLTVTYALTHNPGDYSNVKPEMSLTAELAEGDDIWQARLNLLAIAREHVQEAVDDELVQRGRYPFFDKDRAEAMREEARAEAKRKEEEAARAAKQAESKSAQDEVPF